MQLRFNVRLYPTAGQRGALAQAFGCTRVVFNDTLDARREAWADGERRLSDAEVSKRLTESKTAPQRAWLNNVSSVVLQQAAADANTAHATGCPAFVAGGRAARSGRPGSGRSGTTGKRSGSPRTPGSRSRPQASCGCRRSGTCRFAGRDLPSDPSSVTVILDAAGRYFASFVVDTGEPALLPPVDAEVGIDLGLASLAVCSNGKVIDNPRYLRKAQRRLKRAQQALSRKEKGSKNRANARVRVARAHVRVADTRRDFAHKLSTTIIRENQAVYVEDLAVSGLARTRLAKSVYDAGWGMFTRMLQEKAARYGRTFAKVDRWFPSSQLCSACGVIDGPKPLSVRSCTCPECGTVHDRDLNAARNILLEGRKTAAGRAASACGGSGSPGLGQAAPDEAGTHRSAA